MPTTSMALIRFESDLAYEVYKFKEQRFPYRYRR
jgi:hypothetical protein